jgi:serine/threonine protein kinase
VHVLRFLSVNDGTVGFKAPELGGINIDYRKCDIYSLGVTFASCISERYKSFYNTRDKKIPFL